VVGHRNFREGQLKRISPGMRADVYVLSKPNVRFTGVVDSIGFGVTPDPDVIGTLQPGLPDSGCVSDPLVQNSRYKNGTTNVRSFVFSVVPYRALQCDRRLVITT
jgi:hypothetical protein